MEGSGDPPLGVEYEGSEVGQPHLLKHQMGTHGSTKIKTPRSKPPKSKLQDPNPQNENSKIQTPKIKTPRSKPPKLQDPNPQNSKIQTPKIKTPRSKPPKSKLQDPNPQNQNSKIQNHDRSPKKNDKYFFRQIISTMSKISKWKSQKKSGN